MERKTRQFQYEFLFMVLLFAAQAYLYFWRGLEDLGQRKILLLGIDLIALGVSVFMFLVLIWDKVSNGPHFTRYARVFPVVFMAFWMEILCTFLSGIPEFGMVVFLSVTLCHVFSTVTNLFLFRGIISYADIPWVKASRSVVAYDVLVALSLVAHVFNLIFGFLFYPDGNGEVLLGPVYYLCGLVTLVGILVTGWLVLVASASKAKRKYALIYLCFPLAGCLLDIFLGMENLSPLFCLFSLILLYVDLVNRRSLALSVASERLRENQEQEQEQEQKILLSQIQPHFIFNTLSVIASLCRKDPETASRTTDDFSAYLKDNLESISSSPLTPFSRELDHIRKYVNIQKVRFGEDLSVVYDIGPQDFLVPALSIQPLVENAIIHGIIRGKQEAGTVRISTSEDDSWHRIVIQDDGIGFEPDKVKHDDGRVHVGLENSRERVENLTGGRIEVESVLGQGTTMTILIPRKEVADGKQA